MTDDQGRLAPARRAHVMALLARDGHVRISRLSDELRVSPVTLRRDLAQLERDGLVSRVHGGAVVAGGVGEAPDSAAPPSGSIAVLVPSLSYYWPTVVRGIEAEAQRRGLRMLLRGASYDVQDERPVLQRLLRDESVRGLIVAPNSDTEHAQDVTQWLAECGVPAVLVERDATVLPGHSPAESVTSDHALGAAMAARHLASLGHRQIGLVLTRSSPTSRKIVAGWRETCEELGLGSSAEVDVVLPDRQSPSFSAGVDSVLDAAEATGVTGLLVHSDREAMAVVDLALSRGMAVPDDLSVIAYDDEVAELFTPALTAVSPPRQAVGRAAVDLVIQRMSEPDGPTRRVLVSPKLVERETTSPARR